MKKLEGKRWLPYIGLPVLCVGLAVLKWETLDRAELLLLLILTLVGYLAAVSDLLERKVPNRLILILVGAWVLVMVPQMLIRMDDILALLLNGLFGFILSGVISLSVYFISRRGLGGGDVKLMAVSGLYLGVQGSLTMLLYGSVLAAVTGGVLILCKKIKASDSIPLVPFLYIGMLLTMFIR